MEILLATSNPHKLDEIRAIIATPSLHLLSLRDLASPPPEPPEDHPTFEGNATLKARYYSHATGLWCLADDSGLEVDALHGEPGVRSARYAGVTGPRAEVDLANNRLLLQKLQDVPAARRSARFVCAMALFAPAASNRHAIVRGTVEGRILEPSQAADPQKPELGRGKSGFGYDPLFLIPELGKTAAELRPEHKNRISHRGQAARLIWQHIQSLL